MPTPIVVMAGQSNANALYGANGGQTLAAALAAATGAAGIATRLVFANGAPLTFGRADADWYDRGELPAQLLATLRAALDADPGAVLSGILWVQGEGDTHAVARAAEYGARLAALVDWIADGLAGYGDRAAGFRVSVLALSAQAPEAADRANWQTVRAQQLALDHPRIDVTDPDAVAGPARAAPGDLFQPDGLHYAPGANDAILDALTRRMPLSLGGTTGDDRLSGRRGNDVLDADAGDDLLRGGAGDDTLWARDGDDVLSGGPGRDVLVGAKGSDTLWGGNGADRFVFLSATERDRGATDRIADFRRGLDRIDLSNIDADATRAGDQSFRLQLGPGGAGALWATAVAGGIALQLDTGGDGQADATVILAGVTGIDAADLWL